MGRKSRFVNSFSKWINYRRSDRSKLLKSVVSLVLASVILATCTVCWYVLGTAQGSADNFTLNAGKGLRVNDTGTSQFSSAENDFKLLPASSVDGRNLYFPTDGTDFSDVTKEMTFRSANAGDKNVNFIQIDFDVTAQTNLTSIYINPEKTFLKVYDKANDPNAANASAQQAAPLRMAIWSSAPDKNGNPMTPVVFNSRDKTVTIPAVSDVDRGSGTYLGSTPQVAHRFSDYAVGGTPITTLSAGKKTYFSVIIWLEGNDPKCKAESISKSDIKLGLAFKTSWDNTEVIRIKDATGSYAQVQSPTGNPSSQNYYELSDTRYYKSKDTSVVGTKTYYTHTAGWIESLIKNQKYNLTARFTDATGVYNTVLNPTGNPSTQNYYEYNNGTYSQSSDTTVVNNKTYYLPDMVDFHTYSYRDTTDEWTASIPSDMKNKITFILSPPSSPVNAGDDTNTYVFCVNSKTQTSDVTTQAGFNALTDNKLTYNRGVNRQYVVDVPKNTSLPSACRGYWTAIGDSDGGGVDIGDLDDDDF